MKLTVSLLSCVLATNRVIRQADYDDLELYCISYEPPTPDMTDEQVAELRYQYSQCLTLWGGESSYRAFGGECFTCPCWCEARPNEETCNGETRGEFNGDIFLPYGETAGDFKLQSNSLGVDATHTVDHDFVFFGKGYRNFFISSHGFIHFRNAETTNHIDMEDRYNNRQAFGPFQNMIAPFWSDFNMAHDGILWYRSQSTNLDELNQIINDAANHGLGGGDYDAVDALIVTWDTMVVTSRSENEVNDRRNTFQTVLTQDATRNSYVIFHYGDIEQDAGGWTGADECTGEGGWNSWVGLTDEFGNMHQLPISHTDNMNEIDKGSNVNVRGRYMLRVDLAEIVLPPVDISIQKPLQGISQVMDQRFHSSVASQISAHGCHCSRMDNSGTGGAPIDELDKICRNWISARRCILKNGGTCVDDSPVYVSFTPEDCHSPDMLTICEVLACEIDDAFISEINAYLADNPTWEADVGADCVPTYGFGKDSCCGSSVGALNAYNSNHHTCENGELIPIG